jgi:hypothetical protein
MASPGERMSVDALIQMPEPCILVVTPWLEARYDGYEHAATGVSVFVGRMTFADTRFSQPISVVKSATMVAGF